MFFFLNTKQLDKVKQYTVDCLSWTLFLTIILYSQTENQTKSPTKSQTRSRAVNPKNHQKSPLKSLQNIPPERVIGKPSPRSIPSLPGHPRNKLKRKGLNCQYVVNF